MLTAPAQNADAAGSPGLPSRTFRSYVAVGPRCLMRWLL